MIKFDSNESEVSVGESLAVGVGMLNENALGDLIDFTSLKLTLRVAPCSGCTVKDCPERPIILPVISSPEFVTISSAMRLGPRFDSQLPSRKNTRPATTELVFCAATSARTITPRAPVRGQTATLVPPLQAFRRR